MLARADCSGRLNYMNSVLEIEEALRQMLPQERREVARWLLDDLQKDAIGYSGGKEEPNRPLPDYSARRRRIF